MEYDPRVLTAAQMIEAVKGAVILSQVRRAIARPVRKSRGERTR